MLYFIAISKKNVLCFNFLNIKIITNIEIKVDEQIDKKIKDDESMICGKTL